MRIRIAIIAVLLGVLVLPAMASEAETMPDGLLFSTFSLCAVDPETQQSGVAVTTRVPFVGRAVPWVRAGVGAVATQSWTVVEYGTQGLDLLEEGVAASTRQDGQAKSLGEWLRSRVVDVPEALLP